MKTEKRKARGSIDSMNSYLEKVFLKKERGSYLDAHLAPDGTLTISTNSKVALSIFEQDFLTNEN